MNGVVKVQLGALQVKERRNQVCGPLLWDPNDKEDIRGMEEDKGCMKESGGGYSDNRRGVLSLGRPHSKI